MDVHPFAGDLTRAAQRHKLLPDTNEYGIYKITDLKAFAELPKFEWNQLFNFQKK